MKDIYARVEEMRQKASEATDPAIRAECLALADALLERAAADDAMNASLDILAENMTRTSDPKK
jgi:hypothetical protein